MVWNFDISTAPRGEYRTVTRIIGKNEASIQEYIPAIIIAAGADGVVTVSRWMPDHGRWLMFSKGTPPLAWHPWPAHPDVTK